MVYFGRVVPVILLTPTGIPGKWDFWQLPEGSIGDRPKIFPGIPGGIISDGVLERLVLVDVKF
eukprot:scaffold39032_cov70-Cyclotella_meneghiniana.AAC.1